MSDSSIFILLGVVIIYALLLYFIISRNARKKIQDVEKIARKYSSLDEALKKIKQEIVNSNKKLKEEDVKFSNTVADLVSVQNKIEKTTEELNNSTELLSRNKYGYLDIKKQIEEASNDLNSLTNDINKTNILLSEAEVQEKKIKDNIFKLRSEAEVQEKKTKDNTFKLRSEIMEIEKNKRDLEKKLEKKEITYGINSKKLADLNNQISTTNVKLNTEKSLLLQTKNETRELQKLKGNSSKISKEIENYTRQLVSKKIEIKSINEQATIKNRELHDLMSKIDLYGRLDDFVEVGFFEKPEYLYETSLRFEEEIKRNREKQKKLIKDKIAITYPDDLVISDNSTYNQKIINGQVKLMLTSFNVECDTIISKISPSNFSRTLERIDNLATSLEKSAATLFCGFNIEYVKLKYEESKFQYQFKLKKQEEQEEQSLIREQIREEQKALNEYDRVVAKAEKEARIYKEMLEKARTELSESSNEDKIKAEQRISALEQQLSEVESQKERALSMAEQTKKGHVYVISNIGSFGDGIYKIGLTRRLEPLDRVKELGGASVPFLFDVHAMIYAEDAPALERILHKEFTSSRVNAVNLRKEFFRVDLQSIKQAVKRIAGTDVEFKTTILANEYYETRRLQKSL